MRRLMMAVVAVSAVGCGIDSVGELNEEGLDDGVELTASELDASLMLPFVNGATTTYSLLTATVRVEARAAKGLIARRDGLDALFGTADDKPFLSIADLDAVPFVGPAALARIDQYAIEHFGSGAVTVDGVTFSADEARAGLAAVNGDDLFQLGLSSTAHTNLLAARPFTTLQQVAAVPWVGTTALTAIRNWALGHPGGLPAGACTAQGGTFDGVTFTAAEDCNALEFLRIARMSEMRDLPKNARDAAWGVGIEPNGYRKRHWASLKEFSMAAGIGTTAMNGVKTGAAHWTANGLGYDTVAATWTNRATLWGAPIDYLKVYVTKVLPERNFGGYRMQCAELRDSPTAANYLTGCYPAIWCSDSGTEPCWPMGAGTWVSAFGTLRTSSEAGFGGSLVYLTGRASSANPAIP